LYSVLLHINHLLNEKSLPHIIALSPSTGLLLLIYVADEFLRSSDTIKDRLPGPYFPDSEHIAPHKALFKDFLNLLPSFKLNAKTHVVKAWDYELARRGVERPRTIKGIAALSGLYGSQKSSVHSCCALRSFVSQSRMKE
jgi:hypothetical protein